MHSHWLVFWSNAWVRIPLKFYLKAFLIISRYPMEKNFSKSNKPFLSYQPTSTRHLAHLGQMAGATWLVFQKGLIWFWKFLLGFLRIIINAMKQNCNSFMLCPKHLFDEWSSVHLWVHSEQDKITSLPNLHGKSDILSQIKDLWRLRLFFFQVVTTFKSIHFS